MDLTNIAATFPSTDADCEDRRVRRRQARASEHINGIDYVEVVDEKHLDLYLLKPAVIAAENITISEVTGRLKVVAGDCTGQADRCYRIELKTATTGNHTLTLHAADEKNTVLDGFDPLLSTAEFSFGVDKPTEDDLPKADDCPPPVPEEPTINYLAKDYASFRQLMLDRLALIMPDWKERHVPDLGITLIEVLAYVGDYLSYYQDAVATEAYLYTARQRRSIRRHARLVDYHLHEGCNARAWVQIEINTEKIAFDMKKVYFVTDYAMRLPVRGTVVRADDLERLEITSQYEVFHPMRASIDLYAAHNRIEFYTWGERECCLPKGATHATVRDGALKLKEDDVLIFEERIDPSTGNPADADPKHRHAVRLKAVKANVDPATGQAVVEIAWDRADALPFPLCLSATTADCGYVENISVALGNIVLVDHGRRILEELEKPEATDIDTNCDPCGEIAAPRSRRYEPRLREYPLVYREPLVTNASAHETMHPRDPHAALPIITLNPHAALPSKRPDGLEPFTGVPHPWEPDFDLISSGPDDREFVVEPDDDGVATLRFGDGELGESPTPGTIFIADYRVGVANRGNVGADAIRRIIFREGFDDGIANVRNPLPAHGGTPPESTHEARLRAPHAFRQWQERAITADDYAALVERLFPDVQKAHAKMGANAAENGRYNVDVWYDPLVDAALTPENILKALHKYRRIGHDIQVPKLFKQPFTLTATVWRRPNAITETVNGALEILLGSSPEGLFYPDKLTFGTIISLSAIAAEIQKVAGVAYVEALETDFNYDGKSFVFPVIDPSTQFDHFILTDELFPNVTSRIVIKPA